MARRRGRGEGSVYRRKSDGRWCGSFIAGYDEDGKPKRRIVYGRTQGDVVEKLREVQQQAQRNELPEAKRVTVAEWCREWLDGVQASQKLQTHTTYEVAIRLHVIPHIGGRALSQLRTTHISNMLRAMAAAKVSVKRQREVIRILRTSLRAAMNQQPPLLVGDPIRGVALPRIERRDVSVVPERKQVATIRRLAREAGTLMDGFVSLGLGCGLRFGEAAGLRWGDLALGSEHAEVRVRRQAIQVPKGTALKGRVLEKATITLGPPKSAASEREVPLPDFVREALLRHRAAVGGVPHPDRLVFPMRGGSPMWRSQFAKKWNPIRTAAGLPRMRYHDLRHLFATNLVSASTHPKTLQVLMGHESPLFSLKLYAHVEDRLKDEAAAKLHELYAG